MSFAVLVFFISVVNTGCLKSNLKEKDLFSLKVTINHQMKPKQKHWEKNWSKNLGGAIFIVSEIHSQLQLLYSSVQTAQKPIEESTLLHQSITKKMSHKYAHSPFNEKVLQMMTHLLRCVKLTHKTHKEIEFGW